ncbi:hypothetical protein EDEG_01839, partial [Edhazardia aedis USNM 41457]
MNLMISKKNVVLAIIQTIFSLLMIYALGLHKTMPLHCLAIGLYTPLELFRKEKNFGFLHIPLQAFFNHSSALLGTFVAQNLSHFDMSSVNWKFSSSFQILGFVMAVLYFVSMLCISNFSLNRSNNLKYFLRCLLIFLMFSWRGITSFILDGFSSNEFGYTSVLVTLCFFIFNKIYNKNSEEISNENREISFHDVLGLLIFFLIPFDKEFMSIGLILMKFIRNIAVEFFIYNNNQISS